MSSLFRITQRALSRQSSSRNGSSVAAAAVSKSSSTSSSPIEVSVLENGLTVAAVDSLSPISTIGAVVASGSKHEKYENAGVTHALRINAELTTKRLSSFGLNRGVQQLGASLVCTQGREYTAYCISVNKDFVDEAIEYLMESVCNPAFKPWELEDRLIDRLNLDRLKLTNDIRCTEMLHKAAFRSGGIGNSLYIPKRNIGKITAEMLREHHAKHYTGPRCALVGTGLSLKHMVQLGSIFEIKSEKGPGSMPAKYYGGESRLDTEGSNAYVAVATQSSSYKDVESSLVDLILQRILGTGSLAKRGTGSGALGKAVSSVLGYTPHSVNAINYQYLDNGLMGAFVVTEAAAAGKAVDAIMGVFKNLNVTDEDVLKAKKKLIVDLDGMESLQVEDIGAQLIQLGDVKVNMNEIGSIIESISTAKVQESAKKLSSPNLTLSAVGNLSTVPYLDSLQ